MPWRSVRDCSYIPRRARSEALECVTAPESLLISYRMPLQDDLDNLHDTHGLTLHVSDDSMAARRSARHKQVLPVFLCGPYCPHLPIAYLIRQPKLRLLKGIPATFPSSIVGTFRLDPWRFLRQYLALALVKLAGVGNTSQSNFHRRAASHTSHIMTA